MHLKYSALQCDTCKVRVGPFELANVNETRTEAKRVGWFVREWCGNRLDYCPVCAKPFLPKPPKPREPSAIPEAKIRNMARMRAQSIESAFRQNPELCNQGRAQPFELREGNIFCDNLPVFDYCLRLEQAAWGRRVEKYQQELAEWEAKYGDPTKPAEPAAS